MEKISARTRGFYTEKKGHHAAVGWLVGTFPRKIQPTIFPVVGPLEVGCHPSPPPPRPDFSSKWGPLDAGGWLEPLSTPQDPIFPQSGVPWRLVAAFHMPRTPNLPNLEVGWFLGPFPGKMRHDVFSSKCRPLLDHTITVWKSEGGLPG